MPQNASVEQGECVHTGKPKVAKWSFGVLNDKTTDEVPGSVLLLSGLANHNEPLGLRHIPSPRSNSSLASRAAQSLRSWSAPEKKRTKDGKIILEPQPEDSMNDPLNWSLVRREAALFSLGLYCMVGGGMTPILAAGFTNVAETYDVSIPRVALTTGLYMMGLGVGSVIASPTAIAFGKRPVYLATVCVFMLTAVWAALSPSYASLVIARVFQGMAVSPVECLPSATIAEIFFLHERAYRVGIYTLLLLGGKNIIPLVSAAIIQSMGWRWVFWIVAMVASLCFCLLFLFVPETFWDRTPRPHKSHRRPSLSRARSHSSATTNLRPGHNALEPGQVDGARHAKNTRASNYLKLQNSTVAQRRQTKKLHFAAEEKQRNSRDDAGPMSLDTVMMNDGGPAGGHPESGTPNSAIDPCNTPETGRNNPDSPNPNASSVRGADPDNVPGSPLSQLDSGDSTQHYTGFYRHRPQKSYLQTLKPYDGRLSRANWFRVAFRPFILFAYPSILWSTMVYSLSVGWLIVLSESVSEIFRNKHSYNFSALQTGLVYISPFIGGVLGTAVAGKVSDLIVRLMSRKNQGIYEPEFRLVMAIPVAICTAIGLMGYGWAAQERDAWIVPTVFFGIISFGCSIGSTTAITFALDSYRQYASEALVTLNFSKNIFHGLVFSLFFNSWLQDDGPRLVFLALGVIQVGCLLATIPMFIFGKRARMWTVRKNFMEKF